jgi:hypothetical protein
MVKNKTKYFLNKRFLRKLKKKENMLGFKKVGISKSKEKDSFTSILLLGHPLLLLSAAQRLTATVGQFFFSFVQHLYG